MVTCSTTTAQIYDLHKYASLSFLEGTKCEVGRVFGEGLILEKKKKNMSWTSTRKMKRDVMMSKSHGTKNISV